jgi:hypothetical protein
VSEPLSKPDHLRPVESTSTLVWLARRKAAASAAVLGVLSFIVVAIAQGEVWATPDWRVSLPGFALTAIAAAVSLARREPRGYWLWALGLGLAGASLVLGWFLMVAVIVGAAAVLILILHALL